VSDQTHTLLRLTVTELRKIGTTRSSLWLTIVAVFLGTGLALLLSMLQTKGDLVASGIFLVLSMVLTLIAPFLGVLVMTQDWQYREVVGLFLAQPHRSVVFGAKVLATALLGAVLMALSVIITIVLAGSLALALGQRLSWWHFWPALWSLLDSSVFGALNGAAYGALIMNAGGAIALLLGQKLVLGRILVVSFPGDFGLLFMPASLGDVLVASPNRWIYALALLVWTVLPLGLGWWRNQLREAG
jgi:hypothetical protein